MLDFGNIQKDEKYVQRSLYFLGNVYYRFLMLSFKFVVFVKVVL